MGAKTGAVTAVQRAMPSRAPGRGPPYWKSQVLRRQAVRNGGDGSDQSSKGERGASPWGGESLALGHEAA